MEQTTQSPPAEVDKPAPKPAPAQAAAGDRKGFSHAALRAPRVPASASAVVIGVMVLLVVGFFVYRYVTSYESTDDAQVDGHVNSISARVSGHVIKLNVEDNQYVQAGTVLVEIDPADYQVAYERAKADFEDAQAAAVAAGVSVFRSPR